MDLSTRQGRHEQGLRIQRAVERAGLSIEETAGRIGCSRALIYQYVSGTTLAQPDRLQQIAQICNVPLPYFYADTVSDESPAPASETTLPAPPPPQEVSARLADSLRALQELAEAQENPPDYRALASTCERILSLSAQQGDRPAQARAQRRLGNARLRTADYPRAADALAQAVTLAQEAADTEGESAARQSLGNALLAMGRIREAREQFTRVANGPGLDARWQGTLSLGCIHEMQGEYQKAMARFDEAAAILDAAEADGSASEDDIAVGRLYVTTNRRNVYMDGGDFRGAKQLAERGMADAEARGNADQHLEARFDLAWCDFSSGQWQDAYKGWANTLQLARFVGDMGRETLTRAWLGIFLAAAGDFDTATAHGKDALATALSRGDRRGELYAQLALADAYTGATGRDSEARYHTNQALAVTAALRHERGEIECRLRLARLNAQTGETGELRDAAARALNLSQKLGARHLEALARCYLAQAAPPENDAENAEADLPSGMEQAQDALGLADEIDFCEARWRSRYVLARLLLQSSRTRNMNALVLLRDAVAILEALRDALRRAGISDTLLENADCLAVYALTAELLPESEAQAFLEQAGWPPLLSRFRAETRDAAE